MEYILTSVEQSQNIRLYAFTEIDTSANRAPMTVAVDMSLLRKYAIPLQELPLLCRHYVQQRRGAGSDSNLTYGEPEMVLYSTRRAESERATQERKTNRKIVSNGGGSRKGMHDIAPW